MSFDIFISMKIGHPWFNESCAVVGASYCFYHFSTTVTWHEHHIISNHGQVGCLFNSLFRLTQIHHQRSTLPVVCEGNPPMTSRFPSQRASDVTHVSITSSCNTGHRFSLVHPLMNVHHYAWTTVKPLNISYTLVGNKIVYHSDVVGASPVGAAPITSSFST